MNRTRMEDVLVAIEADPDSFDMATYYSENSCGTTACLAGHTCLLMGLTPTNLKPTRLPHTESKAYRTWMEQPSTSTETVTRHDGRTDVYSVARIHLGLTVHQADALFLNSYDVRTVEDLRLRVKEVCGDE